MPFVTSHKYSQCTALHPVAFFRCRVLAIHFGLVPSGPRWNGKTAVRNTTFYVLFPLCLLHKFLFPLSPALAEPLLEIRAVPPGQKNSLETVQAQVEGNATRIETVQSATIASDSSLFTAFLRGVSFQR